MRPKRIKSWAFSHVSLAPVDFSIFLAKRAVVSHLAKLRCYRLSWSLLSLKKLLQRNRFINWARRPRHVDLHCLKQYDPAPLQVWMQIFQSVSALRVPTSPACSDRLRSGAPDSFG